MSIRKGNVLLTGRGLDGNDGESLTLPIEQIEGTEINLEEGKIYNINITSNTTFILPTITDGKFHQILIFANVSNNSYIDFGTNNYFYRILPEIDNGKHNIIYEFDGTTWFAGSVKKGLTQ